jgi:hypothetical protein
VPPRLWPTQVILAILRADRETQSASVPIDRSVRECAAVLMPPPKNLSDVSIAWPEGTRAETGWQSVKVESGGAAAVCQAQAPAGSNVAVSLPPTLTAGDGSVPMLYLLAASSLKLDLACEARETAYPGFMTVRAALTEREPVLGAEVSAVVYRPDGSRLPLAMNDLGVAGDEKALDGVYTGVFALYAGDGTYTFQVTATGTKAGAPPAPTQPVAPPFADYGGQPASELAPFRREALCDSRLVGWSPRDRVPPGPITVLQQAPSAAGRVRLEWLASGDNAYAGAAAAYEIRVAGSSIRTAEDWSAARLVARVKGGVAAGQWVHAEVDTAKLQLPAFISVVAFDEAGNASVPARAHLYIREP